MYGEEVCLKYFEKDMMETDEENLCNWEMVLR